MSYSGNEDTCDASVPFPSINDILAASQNLSYFPPLDESGNAAAGNTTLNTNRIWPDVTSAAFQVPSLDACMTDAVCIDPVNRFQNAGSSMAASDFHDTKNGFSHTAEQLLHQMEQFTSTIRQYGASTSKLTSRIDECGNSITYMEKRLNTIVHQMDNMEERLESMKDLLAGLDLKLSTVDGYLLEIVKREKDIMLQFRDLSQK